MGLLPEIFDTQVVGEGFTGDGTSVNLKQSDREVEEEEKKSDD